MNQSSPNILILAMVSALLALVVIVMGYREVQERALDGAREIRPADPATAILSIKRADPATFTLLKTPADKVLAQLRVSESKRTSFALVVDQASATSPVRQNETLRFTLTQAPGVFQCMQCAIKALPEYWLTE